MTAADNLWRKNEGWSYQQFIESLSGCTRAAVLIGNLNYQVENGGFDQWITNNYSIFSGHIIKYLKEIGTKSAKAVAEILRDVESAYQSQALANDYRRACRSYDRSWPEDGYDDEEERHLCWDEHDERYYNVREQFMADVEAWLQKKVQDS